MSKPDLVEVIETRRTLSTNVTRGTLLSMAVMLLAFVFLLTIVVRFAWALAGHLLPSWV